MKRVYTLHLSEIIYDCDLQLHDIGEKYRIEGNAELQALVERLRSESRDSLLRSCGLACKHLYELLENYVEAPVSGYTNNALISEKNQDGNLLFAYQGSEQPTADTGQDRTFEYVMNLPCNLRKSAIASLGELMHRYVVSQALWDWSGRIGLSDLEKLYERQKAECAALMSLSLSQRSRPNFGETTTDKDLKYE